MMVCVPAFAAEINKNSITTNEETAAPSVKFINFFTDYFKSHNSFRVLDKTGNDINENFYNNNLSNYEATNFKAIKINVWNYVGSICKHTETKTPLLLYKSNTIVTNTSFITKMVSDTYYHPLIDDLGDRFVEVWDKITGTYVYNANTGMITEYSAPKFHVDFQNAGYGMNMYTKNNSTGAHLSSDKYTVTFSVSFEVKGTSYGIIYNYGSVYDELEGTPE